MDRILNDDDLLEAYNSVVDQVYDGGHPLVLEGIKMSIPYRSMRWKSDLTLHIGQRKLFMNELQFLVDHIEKVDGEGTIIYAGSAPSMHLPYLASLYPRLRFVLVDPNEHCLIMKDAPYDRYGDSRVTHYTSGSDVAYVISRKDDRSRFRMANGSYPSRTIQLWNGRTMSKVNRPSQASYPSSQAEIGKRIVSCLRQKKDIRFIISEAYFTDELCQTLRRIPGPVFFWSDIRTSESEYPTEADITINNLLQMRWVSILGPDASMLKFRPAYYPTDTGDEEQVTRYRTMLSQLEQAQAGLYASLLEWAKEKLGIDVLQQARDQRFTAPSGSLYIQPWAGVASGEMRLRLGKWNMEVMEVDAASYGDHMFAYNHILRPYRFYGAHPRDQRIGVDACGDCALEMEIWMSYIMKYDSGDDALAMAAKLSSRTGPMYRSLVDEKHGRFQEPYETISPSEAEEMLNAAPSYASTSMYDQDVINLIMATDPDAEIELVGMHALEVAIDSSPFILAVASDKVMEITSALSSYDGFNVLVNGEVKVRLRVNDQEYIIILTDEEGVQAHLEPILELGPFVQASHPLQLAIMEILHWTNRNRILDDMIVVEMAVRETGEAATRESVVQAFFQAYSHTSPATLASMGWMTPIGRSMPMWVIASRYLRRGIYFFEPMRQVMEGYDVVYKTDAMDGSLLRDAFAGIHIDKMRLYPRGDHLYIMMTGESPIVMDMGMKRWISLMHENGNDIKVRRVKP